VRLGVDCISSGGSRHRIGVGQLHRSAPLTDRQVTAGASKLNATQTKALSENFSSVLGNVTSNPLVKEGVTKAIGPKLGGIIGALI